MCAVSGRHGPDIPLLVILFRCICNFLNYGGAHISERPDIYFIMIIVIV